MAETLTGYAAHTWGGCLRYWPVTRTQETTAVVLDYNLPTRVMTLDKIPGFDSAAVSLRLTWSIGEHPSVWLP